MKPKRSKMLQGRGHAPGVTMVTITIAHVISIAIMTMLPSSQMTQAVRAAHAVQHVCRASCDATTRKLQRPSCEVKDRNAACHAIRSPYEVSGNLIQSNCINNRLLTWAPSAVTRRQTSRTSFRGKLA